MSWNGGPFILLSISHNCVLRQAGWWVLTGGFERVSINVSYYRVLVPNRSQVCGFPPCSWNPFSFSSFIFPLFIIYFLIARSLTLHSHNIMDITVDHYQLSSISHNVVVGEIIIQVGNMIHLWCYCTVYAASMKVIVSTSQWIMECICGCCLNLNWRYEAFNI